jgi:hypothetical protein
MDGTSLDAAVKKRLDDDLNDIVVEQLQDGRDCPDQDFVYQSQQFL